MKKGYNAYIVDLEYKRKQAYIKRDRQNCKEKNCKECRYFDVCNDVKEKNENEEN